MSVNLTTVMRALGMLGSSPTGRVPIEPQPQNIPPSLWNVLPRKEAQHQPHQGSREKLRRLKQNPSL